MMTIKKLVKGFLKQLCFIAFIPFWHLEIFIPRSKRVWVFGSFDGLKYGDNPRALFEYAAKNHPEIKAVWLTRSKGIFERLNREGYRCRMTYSFKGILCALRAGYFFSDHGHGDLNRFMRNGARNIFLVHGMPIKRTVHATDNSAIGTKARSLLRKINYALFPFNANACAIHLLTASSDFFKPFLLIWNERLLGRKLDETRIAVTGLPRNDKILNPAPIKFVDSLRARYHGCRIVLYLPTFREAAEGIIKFSPFADFGFDQKSFGAFLAEENVVFLHKAHPLDSGLHEHFHDERFIALSGNDYDDFYDLLGRIDILVTDYSSAYFDFIITGKPVILTPFDYEYYLKTRGFCFDYKTCIRGASANNWDEFMRIVRGREYYPIDDDGLFNKYRDNHSSERVFELLENERGHLK